MYLAGYLLSWADLPRMYLACILTTCTSSKEKRDDVIQFQHAQRIISEDEHEERDTLLHYYDYDTYPI